MVRDRVRIRIGVGIRSTNAFAVRIKDRLLDLVFASGLGIGVKGMRGGARRRQDKAMQG